MPQIIKGLNDHVTQDPDALQPRNCRLGDILAALPCFHRLGYFPAPWKLNRAINNCGWVLRGFYLNAQYPVAVWLSRHGGKWNELSAIGINPSILLPEKMRQYIIDWTRQEIPGLPTRLKLTNPAETYLRSVLKSFHFVDETDDGKAVWATKRLVNPGQPKAGTPDDQASVTVS